MVSFKGQCDTQQEGTPHSTSHSTTHVLNCPHYHHRHPQYITTERIPAIPHKSVMLGSQVICAPGHHDVDPLASPAKHAVPPKTITPNRQYGTGVGTPAEARTLAKRRLKPRTMAALSQTTSGAALLRNPPSTAKLWASSPVRPSSSTWTPEMSRTSSRAATARTWTAHASNNDWAQDTVAAMLQCKPPPVSRTSSRSGMARPSSGFTVNSFAGSIPSQRVRTAPGSKRR